MNITEFFKVNVDNTLHCVHWVVTLKTLKSVKYLNTKEADNPDNYTLSFSYYLNQNEVDSYKRDFVDKHKLLSVQNVEELDNPYKWAEGIVLRTDDPCTELAEIVKYGSKEAYEASLPEYTDEFMLDIDVRVAMLEMGITE